MTREELLELSPAVDLPTACRALGIGKTLGYELAARGEFPVPVLTLGRLYRVPSEALLQLLGVRRDRQDAA
ncbi:MAG: hypothetical protein ACTHQ3_12725 [Motilibacteraceae bacterium]